MAFQRIQPRVRPGVPAGGQFAGRDRPEAGGVVLSEPDIADVVNQAETSAGYWARRYGGSPEDISSETLLAWWGAVSRRKAGDPICDAQRYIHTTARNMATQAVAGAQRNEDRQAFSAYRQVWAEFCQGHGREPTSGECDEMAATVRMAQPPRRRAREGFQRRRLPDVELNPDLHHRPSDPAPDTSTVGDRMTAVEELAAARGRDNLEAARKRVWDAMADRLGAPSVAAGSITDRAAATARKTVRGAGGAAAVGRRWMTGTCTGSEAAALFAPFGSDLDEDGRDRVVEVMLAVPSHAEDLWDASVAAATAPRANRAHAH